jgi:hypothetical protein
MAKGEYQLVITPADNGFLVQAGCVSLVFTRQQLKDELARWADDPAAVEAEYRQRYRPLTDRLTASEAAMGAVADVPSNYAQPAPPDYVALRGRGFQRG